MVGVFDGHGGKACAQVVAKRLHHYIAACLLPNDTLKEYIASLSLSTPQELIHSYNDKIQFADNVSDLYKNSFIEFLNDLADVGNKQGFEMRKALEKAFLRLDEDLSKEALLNSAKTNEATFSVAESGACACVAHIDGVHLHMAHVGDCCAVLGKSQSLLILECNISLFPGTLSDANEWIANKLTPEHNTDNKSEVDRIIKEHPDKENNIISYGRLFEELQPLRALGDFRYKWSKECKMNFQVHLGEKLCISTADKSPFHYYTPPYLTATPEVNHRRLTPRDKFLVIASDGLWEKVSPLEVVRLVGEHMSGKVTFSRLKLKRNMCLNEINEILLKRKEALKTKPKDSNAATHLIRNAVGGGTEYGIDHRILSKSLSETDTLARYYRDDITVTVVFFDSEYWRDCSS